MFVLTWGLRTVQKAREEIRECMSEKKKILWLSDHPLIPSGVGSQAKYLIEGLLKTGKYRFVCLGGAIDHPDFRVQKIDPEKYGDDWIVIPVKGYGDKNTIRQLIASERPDALFFFTDPRFYVWLWEIEDEVRAQCPMIYWHVWDNDPIPVFNKPFYDATDQIVALSLKTYGLLQGLKIEKERFSYVPHAIDEKTFKPLPEEEVQTFKRSHFAHHGDKRFVLFWNNRNARRKQTGDVIAAFAKFAEKVGKENVVLLMHTAAKDPEGQDVIAVAKCYNIDSNLIISESRLSPEQMNMYYNVADCTINIASNEGFGLGTLESLFCGTPIIAHMTGGLQFQLGDWWKDIKDFSDQDELTDISKRAWSRRKTGGKWWGVPVFPASRSCTGSQQIPTIYDDKVAHEDVVSALRTIYSMSRRERKDLGLKAREWAIENFSMDKMISSWDRVFTEQIEAWKKKPYRPLRQATI